MKKIIILFVVLFVFHKTTAQVNIFITAGGNQSTQLFYTTDMQKSSIRYYRYGYQAGIAVNYKLSKKINFFAELLYAKKGSGITHLNYTNVPLLLGYSLGRFNLRMGSEMGILLSAKQKSQYYNEDITAAYSKIDLAAVGGVSFDATEKFTLNMRFNRGFIPTETKVLTLTNDGAKTQEMKIYNRSIQLSVSFKIY